MIYYKPREIAKLGLIKNGIDSKNEMSIYQYVLDLIKGEKLKVARNYGTGKRPYYKISAEEINRYNRSQGYLDDIPQN